MDGPDPGQCGMNQTYVYSNCTQVNLQAGCYIYSTSNCTSCTGLSGAWWNNAIDIFNTENGNPCELTFAGACEGSDIALKIGIETLTNAIKNIMRINVSEYDWNEKYDKYSYLKERQKLHSIGMIAQELQLIYPDLVYERPDGYLSIKYTHINALLIEGIKEQQLEIETIKNEIDYLKNNI